MLTAGGHKLYFYTRYNKDFHRNDMEIDFLLAGDSLGGKIIPIEVKSAKNYTTSSLTEFNRLYKRRIAQSYIIHPKNYAVKEDGTICIPPYMTICL